MRMQAKGIEKEFAERVFEQIRGFGDYGFPESHAASFAYIAYVSAWLKCHYPEVFVCALLNAQPMGFYSPATLIDDAKRHKLTVLPVDVARSRWDCTLGGVRGARGGEWEWQCPVMAARPSNGNGNGGGSSNGHAQRIAAAIAATWRQRQQRAQATRTLTPTPRRSCGPPLRPRSPRRVGRRIEAAQHNRAFTSIDDFITRTQLEDGTLTRLAEAGAFERFKKERRSALWHIRGFDRTTAPRLKLKDNEPRVRFEDLTQFETIGWDYDMTGHSTRGHPLSPFREELRAMGLPDAKTVTAMRNKQRVSYAGMVINRQRPGTAKGVVFMTLEDETGFVNIVIWKNVFKKHMVIAKTSSFLGVTGTLQSDGGVVHLVAQSLWDPTTKERPRRRRSRDFH